MNDRDCDNCAHHSEGGCSVWECSFEQKEDDTISRQAAIGVIMDYPHGDVWNVENMDNMVCGIKALPPAQTNLQQTCNQLATDTIYRQAAIDTEGLDEQIRCEMCKNPMHTSKGCDGNCKYDERLYERIMQILDKRIKPLPSAQPEIVRCKDCKHFEYDHPYIIQGVPVLGHEVCNAWGDGCKTDENGYCFLAERREDG